MSNLNFDIETLLQNPKGALLNMFRQEAEKYESMQQKIDEDGRYVLYNHIENRIVERGSLTSCLNLFLDHYIDKKEISLEKIESTDPITDNYIFSNILS